MEKSIYIRKEGAKDIVSYLILELLLCDKGAEKTVEIPLGPESKDLTFKELGALAEVIYNDEYASDETYGFSYSIKEI